MRQTRRPVLEVFAGRPDPSAIAQPAAAFVTRLCGESFCIAVVTRQERNTTATADQLARKRYTELISLK